MLNFVGYVVISDLFVMRLERLFKGGFVRHINPHYCYYYYYPGKQSGKYSRLYGLYKRTFFFILEYLYHI